MLEEVLQIRAEMARTSVKKFDALAAAAINGRLLNAFQFSGAARTGRYAGRIFQPQNINRPTLPDDDGDPTTLAIAADLLHRGELDTFEALFPDVMSALSSLIRAAIRAGDGRLLVVCDWSAIENCVVAWLTECEPMLEIYRQGRDSYKSFAAELYSIDYEKVTKQQRKFCKPATLGCQYGLGGPGLQRYALGMGVELSLAEATEAKDVWRGTYPEVVSYWHKLEKAVRGAILHHKATPVGPLVVDWFAPFNGFRIRLPSGRYLHYADAELRDEQAPWGETVLGITYMGQNQTTMRWERQKSFGGKLLENATQAIARDLLMVGLTRADAAGLYIVGHVHDEIIVESREEDAQAHLVSLRDAMCAPIDWAPDLPLAAEGYVAKFYRKD